MLKTNLRTGGSLTWKICVILGLAELTLIICFLVPPGKAGGEPGVVMELPEKVSSLYAFPEAVSKGELQILPGDTTFARKTYGGINSGRMDRILCSIVLSGAEKRSIHRPERCLPAQGWHIDQSEVVSVTLPSGHPLKVTALLLERPVPLADGRSITLHSYYLYWFVGKGITTPSHLTRILLTNWDMLINRVNQRWAYVIVSANISKDIRPNGLDAAQTLEVLKEFIVASAPTFMKSEMANPPADAVGTR